MKRGQSFEILSGGWKANITGFYSRVLTGLHGFFQRINWT